MALTWFSMPGQRRYSIQMSVLGRFQFPSSFCATLCLAVAFFAGPGPAFADDYKSKAIGLARQFIEAKGVDPTITQFEQMFNNRFNRADFNADNVININDNILAEQWHNAKRRQSYFAVFRSIDLNGDSTLSEAEARSAVLYDIRSKFGAGTGVPQYDMEAEIAKRLDRLRAELEVDSIDGLTLEVFDQVILGKLPADPSVLAGNALTYDPNLKGFDANGDSDISRDEFTLPLIARLKEIDKNNDDVISKDELP